MSKKRNKTPFLFQCLKGKKIKFTKKELKVIEGLKPLEGGEWEGKIKNTSTVRRTDRDILVSRIKGKLEKIQGDYCIYCGLHKRYRGVLEREHIAPKGTDSYPQFMFEPENLCLACHRCNFDLKGEEDTIAKEHTIYSKNKFKLVHPYYDDYRNHIKFSVSGGRIIVQRVPRSRKGKYTIKLFELDSTENTDLRSGLLMINELKVKRQYDTMAEAALNNKYFA